MTDSLPLRFIKKFTLSPVILLTATLTLPASATIVEFQTSAGDFQVTLFDETTPITVNNFLYYVNSDLYDNTIIHRSEYNFIIQGGGGYYEDDTWETVDVSSNGSIVNEPHYSNVRGTIAMAKISGDPDSASSEWFFNTAYNHENLDIQNGGFTVFGQVIDNGMTVVDAISYLPTCDSRPVYPLTVTSCNNILYNPAAEHFVIIHDIEIIDDTINTLGDLTPYLTTDADHNGVTEHSDDDGVADSLDAFPLNDAEWFDTDLDGIGNNEDDDDDNDDVLDVDDAFPLNDTEYADFDLDGLGDNTDTDDDADGIEDNEDDFLFDTDNDGLINSEDNNDDNDDYLDENDAFPLDSNEWFDTDGDGTGNNADLDDDNDGISDNNDDEPLIPYVAPVMSTDSGGSIGFIWILIGSLFAFRTKEVKVTSNPNS